MNRSEKANQIEFLKGKFQDSTFFYLTDASGMTVEKINELRSLCYKSEIEMKVVKNTLAVKALEQGEESKGYDAILPYMVGPTSILFSPNANAAAKMLTEFRKDNDKPILRAAYIDSEVYVGDDAIETLSTLKSKEDLIGEIVMLLQSPAKNVISSLKSSGGTIAGILKTLQEKGDN